MSVENFLFLTIGFAVGSIYASVVCYLRLRLGR